MPAWLKNPLWLFLLIVGVYLLAIPVDVMEVDSAQYFSMAREMMERGDYLHFYDRGIPYLDKPPFIFWITALSFNIFGVNEFAFKIPSILFSMMGIFATYRFALLWYNKRTALLAAIVIATTQAYFHFNNDVRTDTYLTNAVIMAMWLLSEQIRSKNSFWWIPGFFFIGIAMLAKGPLGIVIPILGFGTHILLKGEWNLIFRWQWLAGLVVTLLVLSPMMIGLYQQFDLHPSLIVNEKQNVSGLRFFFWEQSFGRITGENVWKNNTGPFFFVHNLAWSFLPWTIAFLFAFGRIVKQLIQGPKKALIERPEWISSGAFLLTFIALSASGYKLPHYIYVTFPFAAILTADFLARISLPENTFNMAWLNKSQSVVLFLCWAFAGIIFIWFFPLTNPLLILVALAGFVALCVLSFKKFNGRIDRFLAMSLSTALSFNILMAAHFYPYVLNYQASAHLGADAVELHLPLDKLYNLNVNGRAMDVYTHHVQKGISMEEIDSFLNHKKDTIYIHTNKEGLAQIKERGYAIHILKERDNYPVTLLSINFANPATREKVVQKSYLISVTSKP